MTADPPSRNDGPDPGLDVDAAFAEIVAHWDPPSFDVPEGTGGAVVAPEQPGARAPLPPAQSAPSAPSTPPAPSTPSTPPAPQGPPEAGWRDPLNSRASWEDEGHFIPPTPPPLPSVEPRRRLAWIGLAGSPVVGLLLLLLQVAVPRWVSSFLVCAFVGGFCYLVATMGQTSADDWSGDDGAVL